MARRFLTVLGLGAACAVGTSGASAQGYIMPSPPAQQPAYSQQGGTAYPPQYGAPQAAPNFDSLDDDDDTASVDGAAPLPPPGPIVSPNDPRYGQPAGQPPLYSSRPVYSDRPMPAAPAPAYSDRAAPPSAVYGDGLRPPQAIGPDQGNVRDPSQPVRLSALPVEDQPEVDPPKQLPPHLRRQEVAFSTPEPAGTIVVDTANTYLYYILGNGRAIRYGVRVGRDGFTWAGVQKVSRKAEWPDWHPPAEMIERQPYLPRFMAGGDGNPMGARAMYLGSTVYRIHGTNQPSTIGKFVSSGCVGMLNEDVSDLYERVKVGTRVVVLPGKPPASPAVASAAPNQGGYTPSPAYGDRAGQPAAQPPAAASRMDATSVQPLPPPVSIR